jgi:hypothetical protein
MIWYAPCSLTTIPRATHRMEGTQQGESHLKTSKGYRYSSREHLFRGVVKMKQHLPYMSVTNLGRPYFK